MSVLVVSVNEQGLFGDRLEIHRYQITDTVKETPLPGLLCPECQIESMRYDPGESGDRHTPPQPDIVYCTSCDKTLEDIVDEGGDWATRWEEGDIAASEPLLDNCDLGAAYVITDTDEDTLEFSPYICNLDTHMKTAILHHDTCSQARYDGFTEGKPLGKMGQFGMWFETHSEAEAAAVVQQLAPELTVTRCGNCHPEEREKSKDDG